MSIQIIDEDGYFVRDYVGEIPEIEVEGELVNDPHYIVGDPPANFYLPKRENGEWVEGGTAPEPSEQEPSPEEQIMLAIAELDMQRATDRLETEMAIADLAETILGGM